MGAKRTHGILPIDVHVTEVNDLERFPPARAPTFPGPWRVPAAGRDWNRIGLGPPSGRLGSPCREACELVRLEYELGSLCDVDGMRDGVGQRTEAEDGRAKVFGGGAREGDGPEVVREDRSLGTDGAGADVCVLDSEFGAEADKEVNKGVVSDAGEGLEGCEEGDAGSAGDGSLYVAHEVVDEAGVDADGEEDDDDGKEEAGAEGALRLAGRSVLPTAIGGFG